MHSKVIPNQYTGKWNGVLYYKGIKWWGPTNQLGRKPFRMVVVDVLIGLAPEDYIQ